MPDILQLGAKVSADTKSAELSLAAFQKKFIDLGSNLVTGFAQGVGQKFTGLVTDIFSNAFDTAKSSIIDFNANLEQTNIAFTTMLGSQEKATAFINDLKKFAETTPFEFQDLVVGAQRMKAFGFAAQEVIPLMTDLGNVVSGLGGGKEQVNDLIRTLGQMRVTGRVLAQDMLQLNAVGIDTSKIMELIAQQTGKTVPELQKLQEAGNLSSEAFISAFSQIAKQDFGGLMQKQSNTFIGALSNIHDAVQLAFSDIGKSVFQSFSGMAQSISTFLTSEKFKQWVGDTVERVDRLVTLLSGDISKSFSDFSKTVNGSKNDITAMAFAFYAADLVLRGIGTTFIALGKYAFSWTKIFTDSIGTVMTYLGDLSEAFDAVMHKDPERYQAASRKFLKDLGDGLGSVKGDLENMGKAQADFAKGMGGAFESALRDTHALFDAVDSGAGKANKSTADYTQEIKKTGDTLDAINKKRADLAEKVAEINHREENIERDRVHNIELLERDLAEKLTGITNDRIAKTNALTKTEFEAQTEDYRDFLSERKKLADDLVDIENDRVKKVTAANKKEVDAAKETNHDIEAAKKESTDNLTKIDQDYHDKLRDLAFSEETDQIQDQHKLQNIQYDSANAREDIEKKLKNRLTDISEDWVKNEKKYVDDLNSAYADSAARRAKIDEDYTDKTKDFEDRRQSIIEDAQARIQELNTDPGSRDVSKEVAKIQRQEQLQLAQVDRAAKRESEQVAKAKAREEEQTKNKVAEINKRETEALAEHNKVLQRAQIERDDAIAKENEKVNHQIAEEAFAEQQRDRQHTETLRKIEEDRTRSIQAAKDTATEKIREINRTADKRTAEFNISLSEINTEATEAKAKAQQTSKDKETEMQHTADLRFKHYTDALTEATTEANKAIFEAQREGGEKRIEINLTAKQQRDESELTKNKLVADLTAEEVAAKSFAAALQVLIDKQKELAIAQSVTKAGPNTPATGPVGPSGRVALQSGGIVTSPLIASIAEHEPEAVIPLSRMPQIFSGSSMPNQIFVFNINGNVIHERDFINQVKDEFLTFQRHNVNLGFRGI